MGLRRGRAGRTHTNTHQRAPVKHVRCRLGLATQRCGARAPTSSPRCWRWQQAGHGPSAPSRRARSSGCVMLLLLSSASPSDPLHGMPPYLVRPGMQPVTLQPCRRLPPRVAHGPLMGACLPAACHVSLYRTPPLVLPGQVAVAVPAHGDSGPDQLGLHSVRRSMLSRFDSAVGLTLQPHRLPPYRASSTLCRHH